MPRLGPTSRHDLIRYLHILGFEGPLSGKKHQFMVRGEVRLRIPNPHQGELGRALMARILRQAGIDRETWEKLD